MCSVMEELAGKGTAVQLRRRRRLLGSPCWQAPSRQIRGAEPQHLWVSLRSGAFCGTSRAGDNPRTKSKKERYARRSDVYNRNTKELFNWHACFEDLEGKYTGNGPIDAQRGISTS